MSKNLLVHIADRVLNRPLMIHPDKLALIASVLEGRIGIDASELKELDVDERLRSGPDASRYVGRFEPNDPNDPSAGKKPYRTTADGVAVIPVIGSLANRYNWLDAASGMTSYETFKYQVGAAARDSAVSSIVLDMDSPGGEAVGAFEAGDAVREAAKAKPVIAVVNGMAASAAYAIASAATQIVTTASGVSGSIGVVLLHTDVSHALHERGVKPTLIHAGARKVDGNPYQPLTDDVKAELKAEVDQFYDLFVSGVAKGRKGRMTEKSIRGTEARTFIGQAAVDVGVADAVGSFETVLADLSRRSTVRNSNPKRLNMSDKSYSQADLDAAVATARTDTLNSFKAEHETAIKAATDGGKAEGAKAERERIKGILGCEEAKGRSSTALHIATSTDMTVDAAKSMLAASAKEVSATTSSHGLYLKEEANPIASGDKNDFGWGDVVAKINKQFGSR